MRERPLLTVFLLVSPLLLGVYLYFLAAPGAAQRGSPPPTHSGGKVVNHSRSDMRPLPRPVTVAPRVTPPVAVRGHAWRWHPRFGVWIAVPSASAPAEVLLPENYALPAMVQTYEPAPAAADVICPFCGHPLHIEVR